MNLLSVIDQILMQIEQSSPQSEDDHVLGLPSSLTGIDLKGVQPRLKGHVERLGAELGREIHPAIALLDLAATEAGAELSTSIDDFCVLKKTALRDLLRAALYDNLTSLYSRNTLESRLQEEFRRAVRYNLPLSILFIDIDGFKAFNDTYGHAEGDHVLTYVGRFIRDHLREVDFPVRYGGDEFVVILPHTEGETALSLAKRIRKGVAEPQKNAELRSRVTVSVGVSTLARGMTSEDQLLDAADRAAYKAKTHKNMVWPVINADPEEEG